MIDDIYNKDVLRLAADIGRTTPLTAAHTTATMNSPLCGSTITVELNIEDGVITDYAQQIKACALGQAAASALAAIVAGKNRAAIVAVHDQMLEMLAGGPPPTNEWSALAALAPATEATSRHGAIMLPFKAVLQAWDDYNEAEVPHADRATS